MRIAVITGTEIKGCTQRLTQLFLDALGEGHTVESFVLPKDGPAYCTGCKTCFLKSEERCPHAAQVMPIWQAMRAADLIVLSYPVYALRAPGQVKALLDHLCVRWFVHRPDPVMFSKRAVIITQAIGVFYHAALKDAATSLKWLGVSDVRKIGFGLIEDVFWDKLSAKRRAKFTRRLQALAARYRDIRPARMSPSVWFRFHMLKLMHRIFIKKQEPLSVDDQYWLDNFLQKRK